MRGLEALLTRQKTVAAGVVVGLVLLGGALYPSLPDPMAVHWNASGGVDGTASKPFAVFLMPAVVVGMSLLFEFSGADAHDRIVGSLAMLLLFVVQALVFLVNLGVDVPIVPIVLALALGLVALAVRYELR